MQRYLQLEKDEISFTHNEKRMKTRAHIEAEQPTCLGK